MTAGAYKIKTKLEQIETAAELVSLVAWQGVSTKQEDICRMQDIIGHSTIEELDRLANDTGDNSTGRRGTRENFYHILSVIWRWDDLIEFWNKHSDPVHEALREAKAKLKGMEEENAKLKGRLDKAYDQQEHYRDEYTQTLDKNMDMEKTLKQKDEEIMKLKAKLYDMMTKGAA